MNELVCSKTVTKFKTYTLSLLLKWIMDFYDITMTFDVSMTFMTSAFHYIFRPIKWSPESKASHHLCYKWPKRAIWSNIGWRCVFGCSNAQVLFWFPTV